MDNEYSQIAGEDGKKDLTWDKEGVEINCPQRWDVLSVKR